MITLHAENGSPVTLDPTRIESVRERSLGFGKYDTEIRMQSGDVITLKGDHDTVTAKIRKAMQETPSLVTGN